MRLYYAPGTCSLAVHLTLREAGLPFSLVRYDLKSGLLESGAPLSSVHPKGYVPVLELDSGERLTEVSVVLQYVADQVPERKLVPPWGTWARYQLMEWLNFIGMEVHKIYWPLFHQGSETETAQARAKLGRSFGYLEANLGERPFLFGDGFTVADAYLATVLSWARAGGVDLTPWPGLSAHRKRIRERPAMQEALRAEGLLR